MTMNWEALLSGGLGVAVVGLIAKLYAGKREDKKDAAGAWQMIADRESERYGELAARVSFLEKKMEEKDKYAKLLEHTIISAGLKLPDVDEMP